MFLIKYFILQSFINLYRSGLCLKQFSHCPRRIYISLSEFVFFSPKRKTKNITFWQICIFRRFFWKAQNLFCFLVSFCWNFYTVGTEALWRWWEYVYVVIILTSNITEYPRNSYLVIRSVCAAPFIFLIDITYVYLHTIPYILLVLAQSCCTGFSHYLDRYWENRKTVIKHLSKEFYFHL